MTLTDIFEVNLFAFVILLIIYFNARKVKKQFFTHRIFITLIIANMILLVVDSMAWVYNGKEGLLNSLFNRGFNLLLYIFAIVPPALWILYTDYQIFRDRKRIKKTGAIVGAVVGVNLLLSILSLWTGWYFSYDANNFYSRGHLFFLHAILCYSMLVYMIIIIIKNQGNIEKNYFRSLLLFPVPILLGSILQVLFYGLSLNWSTMVISLLIVYFNIQDSGLNTDYLTGVFNRRLFDAYLKDKIKESTKSKTFAAILIDMDNFKQINDNLGHQVGDDALKEIVKLLRLCLRTEDMIARFGGDEFYIIIDDCDRRKLNIIVERIKQAAGKFNDVSTKPYKLSFSMGYDIYDIKTKMKPHEFLHHVDELMYDQKKKKYMLSR